jgi:hypothetical protein
MTHVRLRVAATLAALVLTASVTAAPAIEAVSNGLRATGITPGGDAVWFGMTIDTFNLTRRLTRHATIVRDADGDGVVIYALPEISRFSLLFVADAMTGECAVFRAEGVDDLAQDLRGNNWRAGLQDFDVSADVLEFLLVRPGDGAWTMSAMEGWRNDGDGRRDGKFRLKVADMDPIGTATAKPQGIVRRGDLLVVLDPRTFAYAIRQAKE